MHQPTASVISYVVFRHFCWRGIKGTQELDFYGLPTLLGPLGGRLRAFLTCSWTYGCCSEVQENRISSLKTFLNLQGGFWGKKSFTHDQAHHVHNDDLVPLEGLKATSHFFSTRPAAGHITIRKIYYKSQSEFLHFLHSLRLVITAVQCFGA